MWNVCQHFCTYMCFTEDKNMTGIMSSVNHISQHISQLDAINSEIKNSSLSNPRCNCGYQNHRIK